MEFLTALWLPILLSAIFVWIASAIIWMALPYHNSEFKQFKEEEAIRETVGREKAEPGLYIVPFAIGSDAQKPEIAKKFEEGPNLYVTVMPTGLPAMGKAIGLSVVFYLFVSVFVAYLLAHTINNGAEYLDVFRVAGTVAFMAYGFAIIPQSIWFGKPWSSSIKDMVDALIYASLTAGVFGWLWPIY